MTQITPLSATPAPQASAAPPRNDNLGQQDFLRLLTAQLKNQDPLKPLENTEFLGQMAQFSTVAGIDRINATLAAQNSGSRDMRISMAANMLGHSVLVPGAVARPDADGAIRGAVELTEPVEAMAIAYADARSGEILHTQNLGAQGAGLVGFEWAQLSGDQIAARTPVRVSLNASQSGVVRNLDPQVYARVLSARASSGGEDVTLEVEDFGALNTLEILSFR